MAKSKSFPISMLLMLLFGLLSSGCSQVAGTSATAVIETVTATKMVLPTETSTPLPTATATTLPTSTITPVPSPTVNTTVTAQAQAAARVEAMNAEVQPDLEKYSVDPEAGHIVWTQRRPVSLDLTNYMENSDHILDEVGKQSDFVIQSEVTWDTSGALSLCGITFRAEDDFAEGMQDRFFIMRLEFNPTWTIWRWQYGKFQNHLTGGMRASSDIHDDNNSTNLLALVVQGKDINVFINHDKQLWLEETQLKEGLLALSAWQESGKTTCVFENTWVWAFDQ